MAGRCLNHVVKGRRGEAWRMSASEGRTDRSPSRTQRNGKLFVLPIKAGRGRSRGHNSSAGAAGAQAVALEEATNRDTACGRGVTRTTQLRAVGAKLGRRLPAPAGRPGAQGELERNGKPFVLPVTAERGRSRGRKSSAGAGKRHFLHTPQSEIFFNLSIFFS